MVKKSLQERQALVSRYHNGESATDISISEGIPRSTLYTWIKQYPLAVEKDMPPITPYQLSVLERQLKRKDDMVNILQTVNCTSSSPLRDKLNELEKLHGQYSVHVLCDALKVDRGTFYNHIKRAKKEHAWFYERRRLYAPMIQEIFDESNQIFSADKVQAVLKSQGHNISVAFVREMMESMGLQSIRNQSKAIHQMLNPKKKRDHLKLNFEVNRPNEIWVSDTSYIKLGDGWLYICVIIDLYARKVISWRVSKKHSTQLITKCFCEAYEKRSPVELTFHSDRGTQYSSKTLARLLASLGIQQSFSPTASPVHNAVAEAFFSSFKQEEAYRNTYTSEAHAKKSIAQYMSFYNEKRPHGTLNRKTPEDFERSFYEGYPLSRKK